MDQTANLSLPFLMPAQALKHVTHNEALSRLDALVQLSVLDRELSAPPGSPAEGDRHIVAAGATGAWAGWETSVASFADGAWARLVPRAGWLCWVEDEAVIVVWDGADWQPLGPGHFGAVATAGDTMSGSLAIWPGVADQSASLTVDTQGTASSNIVVTNYRDAASEPVIAQRHARGTLASPAALNSSDGLGRFAWRGHDGTGFSDGVLIRGFAQEAWTTGAHGAYVTVSTVPTGSTTVTERMRINAAGDLQMGGANTVINASRHFQLRSYTVATLPSAATAAQLIYVSDGTGNRRLAVSDGSNWRWPDGAVVS